MVVGVIDQHVQRNRLRDPGEFVPIARTRRVVHCLPDIQFGACLCNFRLQPGKGCSRFNITLKFAVDCADPFGARLVGYIQHGLFEYSLGKGDLPGGFSMPGMARQGILEGLGLCTCCLIGRGYDKSFGLQCRTVLIRQYLMALASLDQRPMCLTGGLGAFIDAR